MSNSPGRAPRIQRAILLTLAAIGLLASVGPRNDFGPATPSERAPPPLELNALDAWLAQREALIPNLREGDAKGIIWAHTKPQRTEWVVVYVHGFSASRHETAPLSDIVAKNLGANLFYTRLAGHGRDGAAMTEATVQDWLADMNEAMQIARQLGDKIVLIGCSTGATLMHWQALHDTQHAPAAMVSISPNFGPRDTYADVVNWPWGRELVKHFGPSEQFWTPSNDAEGKHWTTRYPSEAVYPMMALVKAVREAPLERLQVPSLYVLSNDDQVVNPAQSHDAFARLGSPHKRLELITDSPNQSNHVLAGEIKAPQATAPIAQTITDWLRTLPRQ
jgi:alpha-beta hydrolase superfamily lysophospholipase